MQLFYGHYPSLEKKFLSFVGQTRKNPLDKWLVVCASSLLAQHLQKQLAAKSGVLANFHFITVGGLISRLDGEVGGDVLPLFPQDHLRDFLIKEILTEPDLNRYPISAGFVQAVKSSLRDMSDSLVDPALLEENAFSLPEQQFEQEGERLLWLAHVYHRYIEREEQVPGYRSYQNAFERALRQVEKSSYLKEFQQIIWYGFYELSGRQLEFFNQFKSHYPLTAFVAYQKHPAYQFAKKFFETNWLPNVGSQSLPEIPNALGKSADFLFSSRGSAPCDRVQIVSAGDATGEVFYTAKEILRLVEQQGYHFEDVAVVVRTTSVYQDELRHVFAENKIPLNASFSYPLPHYALGNFCKGLFELSSVGFERDAVLKIITSPYFKQPDKKDWGNLIRRSLVKRDVSQWNDLLPQATLYDPACLAWLNHVNTLLEKISSPLTWEKGVSLALQLLKENVNESVFRGKDEEIFRAICQTIEKIKTYSSLRARSHPGEFLREVQSSLSSLLFNEVENSAGGVLFTDALRVRGLQRKVVFALGLNDQVFPLVTMEDPILKDYYRYIMRDVLGYWINQSLQRGDEEKLLFYTVLTTAQEKLYVTYARRREDGKDAVPSVYVAELARACQFNWQGAQAPWISGSLVQRLTGVDVTFLTGKEVSYLCAFEPSHATKGLKDAGLLTAQKETSLRVAQTLHQRGELTPYDGLITNGEKLFEVQNEKGFSPSALQTLAACPLKYFFDKGLQLREEDEPFSRQELSADRKGTAYHEILNEFYQTLYKKHLTHNLFDKGAEKYLNEALEKHYTARSYRTFGIYPVIWEMILENIRQKLTDFVQEDLKQLGDFTPCQFETEISTPPTAQLPIHLSGIMDRLDVNEKEKTFFVVDYKSSLKGTTNLASDLFTYLIFQPFLYVFIALHLKELKSYTSAGSCLLSIQPGYKKRVLTPQEFEGIRERACRFFVQITDQIKKGTFFLCPSDLCAYCPYSMLCRRDSFAALMRARKSEASKALEEARQ